MSLLVRNRRDSNAISVGACVENQIRMEYPVVDAIPGIPNRSGTQGSWTMCSQLNFHRRQRANR